jgi:hypothetical protein
MLFDANLPPEEKCPKGWRQLGCELAELQKGSNLEPYYRKLAEVRALIEADMEFLHPTPKQEPQPFIEEKEKVIDLTHRGAGY